LAVLYKSQGYFAETEPLFKRSLEIKERTLGNDHPDVAVIISNLAELYYYKMYIEAEPLFKRALEIYENALGKENKCVTITLFNLAGLYESQGKYEKAEPLYQRSLEITEKALGKDHPNYKTIMQTYSQMLSEKIKE